MAEEKKAFVAYVDWESQFDLLSDEEAGKLIKHIFSYVKDREKTISAGCRFIDMAFSSIKTDLDRELDKCNYGSSHWNWKGGTTDKNRKIRNSALQLDWRIQVFERDNYTCQHCNKKGGDLNAHHIKSFANHPHLRTVLENGITLCKKCHIQEHKILRNEQKIRLYMVSKGLHF